MNCVVVLDTEDKSEGETQGGRGRVRGRVKKEGWKQKLTDLSKMRTVVFGFCRQKTEQYDIN